MRELPKAVEDCNCNVDLPALRSALWQVMGDPHPTRVLVVNVKRDGRF
jgi:hypothetical protein